MGECVVEPGQTCTCRTRTVSDILLLKFPNYVYVNAAGSAAATEAQQNDNLVREVFLPFRCFCTRKDVRLSLSHLGVIFIWRRLLA